MRCTFQPVINLAIFGGILNYSLNTDHFAAQFTLREPRASDFARYMLLL